MNLIINIYLIIINIVSFIIYFIDKRLAIKHKYRISEKTLVLVSLLGGALGSLLSMMIFHHKTKHIKFVLLNPICLCILLYIVFKINNIF